MGKRHMVLERFVIKSDLAQHPPPTSTPHPTHKKRVGKGGRLDQVLVRRKSSCQYDWTPETEQSRA